MYDGCQAGFGYCKQMKPGRLLAPEPDISDHGVAAGGVAGRVVAIRFASSLLHKL